MNETYLSPHKNWSTSRSKRRLMHAAICTRTVKITSRRHNVSWPTLFPFSGSRTCVLHARLCVLRLATRLARTLCADASTPRACQFLHAVPCNRRQAAKSTVSSRPGSSSMSATTAAVATGSHGWAAPRTTPAGPVVSLSKECCWTSQRQAAMRLPTTPRPGSACTPATTRAVAVASHGWAAPRATPAKCVISRPR